VKFSKRQLPKSILAANIVLPLQPVKSQNALPNLWEVAAWEISQCGNTNFGKYPWKVPAWENTLGKWPLGKNSLGCSEKLDDKRLPC